MGELNAGPDTSSPTGTRAAAVDLSGPGGEPEAVGAALKAVLTDLNGPLRLSWFLGACTLITAGLVLAVVFTVVGAHLSWWESLAIVLSTAGLVAFFSWAIWKRSCALSDRLRHNGQMLADIERQLSQTTAEADTLRDLLVDAVDSVDEGFVLFDANNSLVVCNTRYRAAYPIIADLLVPGASFADILREAAARSGAVSQNQDHHLNQWVDDRLYRHLRSSEPLECQLTDGRWYRISERPTRAGGIVKVLSDITTTKAHQQELANKSDVLESTFEAMAQGVAVFDSQNHLLTWNNHLAAVMEYPAWLLKVGTRCEDFKAFNDQRGLTTINCCDPLPDGTLPNCNTQCLGEDRECTLPSGRHIEVSLSAMPRGGKVVTFADITARKQAESALQHAQKMDAVGQLAGGIAHEFNNMLTSIGGFARMALRSPDDHGRVVMCLGEVTKAADRAASLTSQLLNFSRRSAGEELQPILLKDMIKDLTNFLRPLLGERVDVYVVINDPDLMVSADPARLHQAIVNLCINARDAMPEGGDITLTLSRQGGEVASERHPHLQADAYACLAISDTGTGIDPSQLDRIFEPFFTTKDQGKGTGLGLPMVYSTAEHANGAVDVDSELGKGSTFRLWLPVFNQSITTPASAPEAEPFDAYGLTILLVEDEDSVRRFITMTLEEADCTVLTATNGAEAVAIYQETEDLVDLLISDVVMPTMNGPTLAKTLLDRNPDLKIILMSGYSPTDDWKTLTEGPGRSFLSKPVDPMTLLAAVKAVCTADQEAF